MELPGKRYTFSFTSWDSRAAFLLGLTLSLCFFALRKYFSGFVLDDAFITYRFAENLASGHGIRWNVDGPPVEGFTSFLWMLINAVGVAFSYEPVAVSRMVSGVSALAIIWTLALLDGKYHLLARGIAMAAFALSPGVAILTVSGMETIFSCLGVLVFCLCSVRLSHDYGRNCILFFAFAVICLLTRLDFAAFVIPAIIVHLITLRRESPVSHFWIFGGATVAFLAAVGLFILWKLYYFNDVFPTSFYIKCDGGISERSLTYVGNFMTLVLPYTLITLLFVVSLPHQEIIRFLPVMVGTACFIFFFLFVNPIQGILWRFLMPAYTAIIFVMLVSSEKTLRTVFQNRTWIQAVAFGIIACLLFLHPMHTWDNAKETKRGKRVEDRIRVGKALSGLNGTLLTSESGALPYYSKWRSVDTLGLTCMTIAKNGLSYDYLRRLNPDLIMLLASGSPDRWTEKNARLTDFIRREKYMACAVIKKNNSQYHVYFVKPSSPLLNRIIGRFQEIRKVEMLDIKTVVRGDLSSHLSR